MAMNLARTGTAGVVGVASGVLSAKPNGLVDPINLGGTNIEVATIVEGLALVGGAGLQLLAPFTMPSVADGLVDGGLALLARRGTVFAVKSMNASPYAQRALGNPYAMPNMAAQRASAMARGAVGSVGKVPRETLT